MYCTTCFYLKFSACHPFWVRCSKAGVFLLHLSSMAGLLEGDSRECGLPLSSGDMEQEQSSEIQLICPKEFGFCFCVSLRRYRPDHWPSKRTFQLLRGRGGANLTKCKKMGSCILPVGWWRGEINWWFSWVWKEVGKGSGRIDFFFSFFLLSFCIERKLVFVFLRRCRGRK